jgi:peptidase M23-like protein
MKEILFLLFVVIPLSVMGQEKMSVPNYPQDYFRNPLDIPIFLAGNFGECRPGHFHSGVDIKTMGEENQPVHAAADGYISRIKMDKGGFGHALYVVHPNGYTTLYAHLNKFAPAIQAYLEHEQYAKKRWDVDITLSPTQFPVKKGQQIAWSGNTGGSTAPHLHFEIRNTQTEHPLNPELFGLPIIDKVAPVPTEVVFYSMNGPNGFYGSSIVSIAVEKKGNFYELAKLDTTDLSCFRCSMFNDTIFLLPGTYGIGINVNDFMDGSDNTLAFYSALLYVNDSLQAEITLDNISYDESRYVNAYADYKTKQLRNKWIQLLFRLPGNHLTDIYGRFNTENGLLQLGGKLKIRIVINDDKGNRCTIAFYAQPDPETNCLVGRRTTTFYANESNAFDNGAVSFSLDSRQLYDRMLFNYGNKPDPDAYSDKYKIGDYFIPVHHYFDLKIKPTKTISGDLKKKVVMLYSDDKDTDGRAAFETDSGRFQAKVRNFGTYWLDIDTIPPVIKPLQKSNSNLSKAKQISFEVKDAKTSVRSFSGYLDGKWICFEEHNDLFFYNFDEHCGKGKHALVFRAEDENGNVAISKLNFTR